VRESQPPTTPNLSTRLRQATSAIMERIGRKLAGWGVHPDLLTLFGLAITLAAAVLLAGGEFVTAAVLLLVSLPMDALDGAVARAMQRTNPFGGVLDSTVDRVADMALMLALAYYLAVAGRFGEMALAYVALVGSTMVSYIRARAGAANLPCAGGMFSRLERLAVLLVMLLTGWILPGLIVLAVGSCLTAAHRLWSVAQFARLAQVAENERGA